MSRRITTVAAVVIGAVALTSPTYADRECFGGTCPEVEPPAELVEPPAGPTATPSAAAPALPRVIEPQAAAPATPLPPIVEAPALRPATVASPKPTPTVAPAPVVTQVPAPAPRFTIEEDKQLSRPIRSIARPVEPLPTPETPRALAVEVAPAYVVQQAPAYGAPSANIMIVGAPTMYGDDGVLPAHPNMYPDPAWKLCQIDQRSRDKRYYHCGPYSYHPYGSNGYRPLGTYRAYRPAPAYVYAPSARIIQVEGLD